MDSCSMKIAQDVREYAKEQRLEKEKALAFGMAEKAKEFKATGSAIYHCNLPDNSPLNKCRNKITHRRNSLIDGDVNHSKPRVL